jgi:hypothetical protein
VRCSIVSAHPGLVCREYLKAFVVGLSISQSNQSVDLIARLGFLPKPSSRLEELQ